MATKTTVVIDKTVHHRIKKLALSLGLNQEEVVKKSIELLKSYILKKKKAKEWDDLLI